MASRLRTQRKGRKARHSTACLLRGPVPGQQFGYLFDDLGNRQQTTAGGDAVGSSLRLANYTVNNLNQITSRDYPGTNDVIGAALATNGVTVNGQTAWRKGEYFWATVKTNNAASAQWLGVTVASGGTTNTGNLLFPQTPQNFICDADGNLKSGLNMVASAILADVEPWLPARRNGVTVETNPGELRAFCPEKLFPGGRMPPSTAGKDACRHIFRQALTNDVRWRHVWDAENRLIETESSAGVPPAARMKEEWRYRPVKK